MSIATREAAAEDARAVAAAARSLVRALRDGEDAATSADWVAVQATRVVATPVRGFDAATGDPPTEDETLALAASQLGIGLTLLSAEAALADGGTADGLAASAEELDRIADEVEAGRATRTVHGFGPSTTDPLPTVAESALAALDAMTQAAAEVLTAVWEKSLGALLDKAPKPVQDLVGAFEVDLPGRLAQLGLRAVRRAVDLLLRLVDLPSVERFRDRVDDLLGRMGDGEEVRTLVGAAIGADGVRTALSDSSPPQGTAGTTDAEVVAALGRLVDGFERLCAGLRSLAGLLLGLGGVLAALGVALAQAQLVGAAGLVLLLAALVALGRDHTGASDLPGRVEGVQLLVLGGRPA